MANNYYCVRDKKIDLNEILDDSSNNCTTDSMVCCICCSEIRVSEIQPRHLKSGCNHVFHKICFYEWQRESDSCPVCRKRSPYKRRCRTNRSAQ